VTTLEGDDLTETRIVAASLNLAAGEPGATDRQAGGH